MLKEAGKMKRVGVLSFQGGVLEHLNQIKALGHEAIQIKKERDLENLDAIILPGGESTTMGKLLDVTGLKEPLKEKIKSGIPTWGTCAGMILLAKEIENDSRRHLSLMDIKVRRNAFGTQIDSFKTKKVIKEVSENPLELVFIRAPFITEIKDNVKVLCEVNNNIVAVRQDNMIATSFHPELTSNLTFLKYFLNI
jgi:5'-phosphate synthase pdxT subunit